MKDPIIEQFAGNQNDNIQLYSIVPSPSDGDAIKAKLADIFKDGSVLLEDGDLQRYLIVFLLSLVFFAFNSAFWWKLMEYMKLKQFVQRNHQDKVFFNSQVAGQVHNIVVGTYSAYLIYNSC